MGFFRKMNRKKEQRFRNTAEYSARKGEQARRAERHATTRQILWDHTVISDAYSNLMIVFDVAVHDVKQFGAGRREQLHQKMSRYLAALKAGLVSTHEMEGLLRDEAKMDITKSDIPIEEHDKNLRRHVVNDLSAVFLLALMDEFGYKGKVLANIYKRAADLSDALSEGKMSFEEIQATLLPKRKRAIA